MKAKQAIVVICSLLLTTSTYAQFEITRSVVAGGGGHVVSGNFELTGTIGQVEATGIVSSGSFQLSGGFWLETPPPPPPPCNGDADGDRDVDLSDLAIVLGQFGQLGNLAGDVNNDGAVNLSDLAIVLANFGVFCP